MEEIVIMAFLKKLGSALKAPVRAVGKLPGMGAVGSALQRGAPPGMGAVGRGLGIGPTPNPNAGGMGALAAAGAGFGNMMGRKPQAPPMMPPPQMDQGQMPPPDFQPQTGMDQVGGGMMPLPQGGGGFDPAMQAMGQVGGGMGMKPQMNPKQSMFAQKKPQMQGKAARRGY
jgi:hypothetical protein